MCQDEVKAACKDAILKNWENPKISKLDVMVPVRMHQALDNENEPGWAEVKALKDIVGGCSPNSPEAIELNLARAVKSGGLKNEDIGRALIAFKAICALGIDPPTLAKVMFLEKTICENGVPGSEVGRVLSDGVMPTEATMTLVNEAKDKLVEDHKPADIENTINVYNNLKFKSNIPTEVIEFVDKSLIQVRCSLEDVADNMISSLQARGEKQSRIIGQVTEMLKKTGATAHTTATTLLPPLVDLTGETEVTLTKTVARNLKDVEYESKNEIDKIIFSYNIFLELTNLFSRGGEERYDRRDRKNHRRRPESVRGGGGGPGADPEGLRDVIAGDQRFPSCQPAAAAHPTRGDREAKRDRC